MMFNLNFKTKSQIVLSSCECFGKSNIMFNPCNYFVRHCFNNHYFPNCREWIILITIFNLNIKQSSDLSSIHVNVLESQKLLYICVNVVRHCFNNYSVPDSNSLIVRLNHFVNDIWPNHLKEVSNVSNPCKCFGGYCFKAVIIW